MNLQDAISEPFVKLIQFHNGFNRNIKSSVGALEFWNATIKGIGSAALTTLPTGKEPWGAATYWKNPEAAVETTEAFITELGIVRAASAFEDYITGADAELNRGNPNPAPSNGNTSYDRLIDRLSMSETAIANFLRVVEFFIVARNCIVHRSARASRELVELSQSADFANALAGWPKRNGKWRVSIPVIEKGRHVAWQPRHAIMASDAFFKLAQAIDAALVANLQPQGMVRMAAHWCFFDDNPAPCAAKRNAQIMVRSQLADRYFVKALTEGDTVSFLKSVGKWDDCLKIFSTRFPKGARLRDQRKNQGTSKRRPGR